MPDMEGNSQGLWIGVELAPICFCEIRASKKHGNKKTSHVSNKPQNNKNKQIMMLCNFMIFSDTPCLCSRGLPHGDPALKKNMSSASVLEISMVRPYLLSGQIVPLGRGFSYHFFELYSGHTPVI